MNGCLGMTVWENGWLGMSALIPSHPFSQTVIRNECVSEWIPSLDSCSHELPMAGNKPMSPEQIGTAPPQRHLLFGKSVKEKHKYFRRTQVGFFNSRRLSPLRHTVCES